MIQRQLKLRLKTSQAQQLDIWLFQLTGGLELGYQENRTGCQRRHLLQPKSLPQSVGRSWQKARYSQPYVARYVGYGMACMATLLQETGQEA